MQVKTQGKRTADIRNHLLRQIEIGNFSRGTALPSERVLAERLDASYMTIRKAIGQLVEEHYLERVPRVGTFVSSEIPDCKVQRQLGIIVPAWAAPENFDFITYASEAAEQDGRLPKLYFARHWEDRMLADAWHNCDALLCFAPQPINRMPEELLERFRYYVENIPQRAFYAEYKRRSFVIGKRVEVRSGDLCESGVALDLDENCFLKVRLDSGQEKLLSGGEVSIKVQ